MVKCAECGFLSVRNKANYSLGEPTNDYREKGVVAIGYDEQGRNQHPLHELIPLCFARQFYLRDTIGAIDKQKNQNDEVKLVINKEIDCKEFTKWQQGFTPKEHREMIDREWMMQHEEERENADRKWRSRQDLKLAIVAGVFIVLGALLTWLFTRGGQ